MPIVQVEMLSPRFGTQPDHRGLCKERDPQIYATRCPAQRTATQVRGALGTFERRDVSRSPHGNLCCFRASPARLWICRGQCRCWPVTLPFQRTSHSGTVLAARQTHETEPRGSKPGSRRQPGSAQCPRLCGYSKATCVLRMLFLGIYLKYNYGSCGYF